MSKPRVPASIVDAPWPAITGQCGYCVNCNLWIPLDEWDQHVQKPSHKGAGDLASQR